MPSLECNVAWLPSLALMEEFSICCWEEVDGEPHSPPPPPFLSFDTDDDEEGDAVGDGVEDDGDDDEPLLESVDFSIFFCYSNLVCKIFTVF